MPELTDAFEAAQIKEWSQYVATETIYINGVRAFNEGQPVPAGHVDRGVVEADQVKKVTKAKLEKPEA